MEFLFEDFTEAVILGTGKHSSQCASYIRRKYNITPTVISGSFPFLQYLFCKKINASTDNLSLLYEAIKALACENSANGCETLLILCSDTDREIISALPGSVGDFCIITDIQNTKITQGMELL